MDNNIKPGSLALCQHGILGIVTSIVEGSKRHDGRNVYKGIAVHGKAFGSAWESLNPSLILQDVGQELYNSHVANVELR